MSKHMDPKKKTRLARKRRIRTKISGTADRPRLCMFRSNRYITAQIIDDDAGKTLAAASTLQKELKGKFKSGANKDAASAVGKAIAEKAKQKNISNVVFDRSGFSYRGVVKSLAESAREAGLGF